MAPRAAGAAPPTFPPQHSTASRPAGTVGTPVPKTMRELAAEHGVALEDLVRTPLYGMLAPDAPFFARFEWDMHHEHPVTTAAALGRRVVIEPPPPLGLE